jgi:hypothetical protein
MKPAVLACSAALALAMAPAPVVADAARLLGSTTLTRAENDTDVLNFRTCRSGVNALQIRVNRGQVEIERLWVRYQNGEREDLEVRERIPPRGQSRWIDLRGGERCISAIGVTGDTERSRDRARVNIWGR